MYPGTKTSERPVLQTVFIPPAVWRQNPWVSSVEVVSSSGAVAGSSPEELGGFSDGCATAACAPWIQVKRTAANTTRYQ